MKKLDCLRCRQPMEYLFTEKLQLGQRGWLLGDLPNLLAGALELEIYSCPRCGKVEFFLAEPVLADQGTPQKTCPQCGRSHDFDYPKCPFCQYDYYEDK